MKIDKVEALKVDVPLDKSFGGGTYNVDRRTAIITKIYTNDGIISEVFAGDDRYKSDLILKSINEILGPDIIGSDPNEKAENRKPALSSSFKVTFSISSMNITFSSLQLEPLINPCILDPEWSNNKVSSPVLNLQ